VFILLGINIKANGYGGQNEKITQKVSDTNGSN